MKVRILSEEQGVEKVSSLQVKQWGVEAEGDVWVRITEDTFVCLVDTQHPVIFTLHEVESHGFTSRPLVRGTKIEITI